MSFTIGKNYEEEFLNNCKSIIIDLAKRKERISLEEFKQLRINSYEQKLIYQNLSDEALIYIAEIYLKESGGKLPKFSLAAHYNQALQQEIVPLLIERIKEKL